MGPPSWRRGREAESLRSRFKDFNLQSRRDRIQGEEEKQEKNESQIQAHTNNTLPLETAGASSAPRLPWPWAQAPLTATVKIHTANGRFY